MRKSFVFAATAMLMSALVNAGTIEVKVNGLVCGFCAQGIEKILRKNPATEDVFVSLEARLVAIATKDGQDISDADIKRGLADAGYDVKAIERTETPIAEIRARTAKKANE